VGYPRPITILRSPTISNVINTFLFQFVEPLLLSTPFTLYTTYLTPLLGPILSHLRWRLDASWRVQGNKVGSSAPSSADSDAAARDCAQGAGSDAWYESYYSYAGLFCGDMDAIDNEACVDKVRREATHAWCDTMQSALALKGEWAMTLANLAKEGDPRKKGQAQKTNADGTVRTANDAHVDALNLLRIDAMSQYLLQEEVVAAPVVMTAINCLVYPDAHTTRRAIKICHR
jgi:hypothetical protein